MLLVATERFVVHLGEATFAGFTIFTHRKFYRPVNVEILQDFADCGINEITPELLRENGFVGKNELVKILGNGELQAQMTVKAHAFSKSAEDAITKAGGTIEII